MADPLTTNRSLAVPTRGSDVGTWDVPLNNNANAVDTLLGGVLALSLSNVNVTLTTGTNGQSNNGIIRLTGTLTGNVIITFPAVQAYYCIDNQTTGAFTVTLTQGSGQVIAAPPGVACDVFTDATNFRFKNPPYPGSYWDYAGSTIPAWIAACTINPWLPCDGTAYSRTTYAALFAILGTSYGIGDGSTTFNMPDLRNRSRFYLNNFGNGASNRITTGGSGVDGTTLGASGGAETVTLTTAQIPAHTHAASVTDPGHVHVIASNMAYAGGGTVGHQDGPGKSSASATTGISVTNANAGGGTAHNTVPPALIGGITFVKT